MHYLFTIFALSAGFQLRKKSILKMQVTKTTLTLIWLPVFSLLSILIFKSRKPADNAKMVNPTSDTAYALANTFGRHFMSGFNMKKKNIKDW